MSQQKKKGFTLVELMIVIAIIGILAATLLPTLTGGQARSRDTARKSNLQQLTTGLEAFFQDRAYYPYLSGTTAPANEAAIQSGVSLTGACVAHTSSGTSSKWLTDNLKGGVVPLDPTPNTKVASCGIARVFGYWPMANRGSDNTAYALIANVETYQQANSASGGNMTYGNLQTGALSYASGVANYFTPNTAVATDTTDENSVFFVING